MPMNFRRAALGGFIGTLAMTAMMSVVGPMMGVHMDIAAMLGSMLGGGWGLGAGMVHVDCNWRFKKHDLRVISLDLPGIDGHGV